MNRSSPFFHVLLLIAFFVPAMRAAEVDWEAEKNVATNMSTDGPYIPRNPEQEAVLSAGVWLNGKYNETSGLYADYAVKVPTEGVYQLFVRKFWQHGPMRWRFDKDEWRTLAQGKLLSSDLLMEYVPLNWVKLGEVRLSAGTHAFRVEIIKDPGYQFSGSYGLDAFKLTTGPFLGESITPGPRG
ncbi:MAG: hypothetical protein WC661_09285 [Opitutaceae bacterium]|jgi:hypothetical protein